MSASVQQFLAEGTIVKAYTTALSGRAVPALIYDVQLDAAADFGFTTPNLERVPTLQAGFCPIVPNQEHYTGVVFAPEVGARVLVGRSSRGPIIMGYITGPIAINASDSPELTSYNPGIDLAVARTHGALGTDDIPSWSLDLQPGDVSIGRITARFKINTFGCFAGANASCFTHHGFGGNRIDTWVSRDERGVGFWHVSQNALVLLTSDAINTSGFESAPGASWSVTAYDTDPDPLQMAPYWLEQRGFIAPAMASAGKGSAELAPLLSDISRSRAAGSTVVYRTAVLQPLTVPSTPADEVVAPIYDSRVQADGSWRIRSGNRPKTPSWSPQFDLSFDAASGALSLAVGDTAAAQATVSIQQGYVVAKCVKLKADVLTTAEISAQSVQVGAAEIVLRAASTLQVICPSSTFSGNVAIGGTLNVSLAATSAVSVSAPAVSTTLLTSQAGIFQTVAAINVTSAVVVGGQVSSGGIDGATHTHVVTSGVGAGGSTSPPL